jgi:hypothetical protein
MVSYRNIHGHYSFSGNEEIGISGRITRVKRGIRIKKIPSGKIIPILAFSSKEIEVKAKLYVVLVEKDTEIVQDLKSAFLKPIRRIKKFTEIA